MVTVSFEKSGASYDEATATSMCRFTQAPELASVFVGPVVKLTAAHVARLDAIVGHSAYGWHSPAEWEKARRMMPELRARLRAGENIYCLCWSSFQH